MTMHVTTSCLKCLEESNILLLFAYILLTVFARKTHQFVHTYIYEKRCSWLS